MPAAANGWLGNGGVKNDQKETGRGAMQEVSAADTCDNGRRNAVDRTVQWIAVYNGGYAADDTEEALSAFDYTGDEINKMFVREVSDIDKYTADDYKAEILVEESMRIVVFNGAQYLLFCAGERTILIRSEFLSPIATDEETAYYIRFTEVGAFLCVKRGLIAQAIIGDEGFSKAKLDELISDLYGTINRLETGYSVRSEGSGIIEEQLTLGEGDDDDKG